MKKGFQAVSVLPGVSACAAVKAVAGKRVLSHEAPLLPLVDCTQSASCKCRYQKYADRRDVDDDRRLTTTGIHRALSSAEPGRRKSRGRRDSDL